MQFRCVRLGWIADEFQISLICLIRSSDNSKANDTDLVCMYTQPIFLPIDKVQPFYFIVR